jgi:hypothetical protein
VGKNLAKKVCRQNLDIKQFAGKNLDIKQFAGKNIDKKSIGGPTYKQFKLFFVYLYFI